jgi:hypothetical protein
VWCGDLGCNATLEARFRACNSAARDVINAPVETVHAGKVRRKSFSTAGPDPYEMVKTAIAVTKLGPTERDEITVADGHFGVVPSRELPLYDREVTGSATKGTHHDRHDHHDLQLRAFATVEESIEFVEDELLRWAVHVRKRWQVLDSSFEKYHARAVNRARHSELHPSFDVAQMKDLVEVVVYDRGTLISRQAARDERPPQCIAASARAERYECRCMLRDPEECAKNDHTPCLFAVLSGRVKATKKEDHGQVAHCVPASSIRCGNPACE